MISTFDGIKTLDVQRGEDCMKKFCTPFSHHAIKKSKFKKKKMIPLINEQQELYEQTKICYICKQKSEHKYTIDKTYHKVKDHCYYTGKYRAAVYSIYNLKYSIHKVVFHDGSNYDDHSIIKQLIKELEGEFSCLEEITEKFKTFSVPIKREVKRTEENREI